MEVNLASEDNVKMSFMKSLEGSGSFDTHSSSLFNGWDNNSISFDWYRDTYRPYVEKYYYPYTSTITYHTVEREDKFKKAFTIAKLLLKKKMLESRKLPDFITLVEMIANEL